MIVVEGRDAAGKGGVIKRITEHLNPRWCRIAALPAPSDRETTEWYFQRYIAHLPAGGEIVLFDRSWYNRAGVERVMGFCTDEEYHRFFRQCPAFERMLIDDGIILVKYWFSVSDEEQERRFKDAPQRPAQALEAERHGLRGSQALGRVLEGEGRDVRPLRPARLALVRGRGGRQEAGPSRTASPISCRSIPYEPRKMPEAQVDPSAPAGRLQAAAPGPLPLRPRLCGLAAWQWPIAFEGA